jgi:hypothetical protein
VRILVLEKVDQGFPWTCGKPLRTWTNSFDEGKRGAYFVMLLSEQRLAF